MEIEKRRKPDAFEFGGDGRKPAYDPQSCYRLGGEYQTVAAWTRESQ